MTAKVILTARAKRLPNGRYRFICGAPSCPVELGTSLPCSVFAPDGGGSTVMTLESRAGYWRDKNGIYHLVRERHAKDGTRIGRRPLPKPLVQFAGRPGAHGVHGATPVLMQGGSVIIQCRCGRFNRVALPED